MQNLRLETKDVRAHFLSNRPRQQGDRETRRTAIPHPSSPAHASKNQNRVQLVFVGCFFVGARFAQ